MILFRKLPDLMSWVPVDQVQNHTKSCNVPDDLVGRSTILIDTMIYFAGQRKHNSQAIERKLFPLWGSWTSITKSWMLWWGQLSCFKNNANDVRFAGQTPYGLIIFEDREMVKWRKVPGWLQKYTSLVEWEPNTKASPKPIRTSGNTFKRKTSLHLIMPTKYYPLA